MNDLDDAAAALNPPQYGNSLHFPACRVGSCTGCLPPPPPIEQPPPQLDLSLFRPPPTMRILTRPQDWAAPARAILRERGAWRT
ncbi:hypothetical protein ACFFMR_18925 [Micromonospora andamanensis]|uniref:Uncharacterized protein n=1 Tax=Micromonospora andamanensis TaxID=1287068 RepID=A0ABQ4HYP2_9ACTN|nr:hypothetical protein [Micromonospora andamanensis]GIJ10741.1 hypothetical protein Van01_39550 [Micromonospora andamanensis]